HPIVAGIPEGGSPEVAGNLRSSGHLLGGVDTECPALWSTKRAQVLRQVVAEPEGGVPGPEPGHCAPDGMVECVDAIGFAHPSAQCAEIFFRIYPFEIRRPESRVRDLKQGVRCAHNEAGLVDGPRETVIPAQRSQVRYRVARPDDGTSLNI